MSDSRLLLVPEVADRLRCSRPMAYKLLAEGALPSIRVGTLVRVDSADLEQFIISRKTSCLPIKADARKAALAVCLSARGDAK